MARQFTIEENQLIEAEWQKIQNEFPEILAQDSVIDLTLEDFRDEVFLASLPD